MPRGAPFVLAHEPRPWRRQRVPAIEERVEALHETLRECGDHADLAERGNAVADAELDRAEGRMRPDVPPDLADAADAARCDQRVHEPLELTPAGELPRRAGGGQPLEHLRTARGEAGVVPHPVGAGRAEREEVRDVCRKRIHHGDRLLATAHADVHMDAEDLHLSCRPLHLVDEPLIAWVGTDRLGGRVRERMCP